VRLVKEQFYGDRTGGIIDPFGHIWSWRRTWRRVARGDAEARCGGMKQSAGVGRAAERQIKNRTLRTKGAAPSEYAAAACANAALFLDELHAAIGGAAVRRVI